jgi:signal transduction protein with GAF and PtsI domain
VPVDRQIIAQTVTDLRAALPEADDLLAGLQRVAEATRRILEVDGAGLTLVQEDGQPRWVAATDAAMELLQQLQHDFGEGPYLQAYTQDRAIVVEDLRAAAWTRIDAVVGQLNVRGLLSVPIRLQGQPMGTLDVYSTQPRAWSGHELEAVAEFATVAGELVTTRVELATRELEVTQLRQALASRVWIEQAKGVLAATQGIDPEAAFQQLRARARSSSRKLAVVAQEVVQDAQRRRLAAQAVDDVRMREPRPAPRWPSRPCRPPRPTWTSAELFWTRPRSLLMSVTAWPMRATTPPMSETASLTSATVPLMIVTVSPTNATASPTNGTGLPVTRTDIDPLEPA